MGKFTIARKTTKLFSEEDKSIFVSALSDFVGYEVKAKNLHFASPSKNIHLYIDEFWEKLLDFIDSVAEGYMGINGYLGPNDIKATNYDFINAEEFIDSICDRLDKFHEEIPNGAKWSGLKSLCEDFIQTAFQYRYLFAMSNENGNFGTPISGNYGDDI